MPACDGWVSRFSWSMLGVGPLYAADPLADARRLYNQGQFDAAEQAAREAARFAGHGRWRACRARPHPARAVPPNASGRAICPAPSQRFRDVDARRLDARERVELTIGLAEALYLEERFGAAAELFESVLDDSDALGAVAHERVLDWWATALDRLRAAPPDDRNGARSTVACRPA